LSRPLIGITTRLDLVPNNFYLRRYYSEAVWAAGGDPVQIPLIPDEDYLQSLGNKLDGLMLAGSDSDVDPNYYGEEPHQKIGGVTFERDQTDLILLRVAEDRNIPVFGICFGAQSLNVSRGGKLIQDIPSQVPNALKHAQGEPYKPIHHIKIEADSLIAKLAGGESARVNSSHHQAIREPGTNLRITARAHDGVIECVEDTRPDRWVLGVQWHPEMHWDKDDLSKAIFSAFVEGAQR
jgi:putative glutamine amidotransferase